MAYAGNTGSTLGAIAAQKQVTVLSAIEAMDSSLNRLETLASRVRNCADRVSGSRPVSIGEEQAAKDMPSSLIANAQNRGARLARIIGEMEDEIQRLEAGLA